MKPFKLYPHQEKAAAFHIHAGYSLNGSEMGTGKSLVALEFIRRSGLKGLVVGPAFLAKTWEREAERAGVPIKFIAYSMLHKARLRDLEPYGVWVADEVHYLKSPTAIRTHAFYSLVKKLTPPYFLGLSGTLVKNKVPDLWVPLAICSQSPTDTNGIKLTGELTKYRAFSRHFCNLEVLMIRGARVERFSGIKDGMLPELKGLLEGKYLRVKLLDVVDDMPEMTRKEFYTRVRPVPGLEEAFEIYMAGGKTDPTSKSLSALMKVPDTAEYVTDMLETGESVLVFTDHIASAKELAQTLSAPYITGQMPSHARADLVERFQAKQVPCLVATIGSLSVGVTLTAARHVVFNDMSWCHSDNAQAEARIHRIGQKYPCVAHYAVGSPTDEKITKVLLLKASTAERIL